MGGLIGSGSVKAELRRVFLHPKSKEFQHAQTKKDLFEAIGVGVDNWQDLVAAYRAADVKVGNPWEAYLSKLSPEDIHAIAMARFDGLTRGVAMEIKTHTHGHGNKVVVSAEADGSILIDSPFE